MGILILFDHPIRNWIDSAGTVYFNALEWRIDFSPRVEEGDRTDCQSYTQWKNLGLFCWVY